MSEQEKKIEGPNEIVDIAERFFSLIDKIVFKIKIGYKLELLTPETMKLLGKGKKHVDKDKNGENMPKLESAEVALVLCNLVKKIINTHEKFHLLLFQTNNLDSL